MRTPNHTPTIPLRFPYGGVLGLPGTGTQRYNGTPGSGEHDYAKAGFTPALHSSVEDSHMATMLTEHGTHWVLSQVVGPGKRRRISRIPVLVPKGDKDLLRATAVKVAEAGRKTVGLSVPDKEPVV